MFDPNFLQKAFMMQNIPPTQAGVVTEMPVNPGVGTNQQMIPTEMPVGNGTGTQPINLKQATVQPTAPQNAGNFFSNFGDPNTQKGLAIASVLAKLASGYDKQIGGTGAMGQSIGDIAQMGIMAGQNKSALTPKGVKGTTSRTIVEGPNGERTVTEKSNDFDQVAGGNNVTPQSTGQAFGGTGLPPFDQSAGLAGLDVATQLQLAQMQQDPVSTVVTGDDGKQYGLTRSGNMIALGIGTPQSAPKVQPKIIQTVDEKGKPVQKVIDMQTAVGQAFGATPTAESAPKTKAQTYTKEGKRRTREIYTSGPLIGQPIPGTDLPFDWKPNERGSKKSQTAMLEVEKRRQDLMNTRDEQGFIIKGPQLRSHIIAANADLAAAKAPYRYEYFRYPEIDKGTFSSTDEKDILITTPVDKKGNPKPLKINQLIDNLMTDHGMDLNAAREEAYLYYYANDALDQKTLKKARREFKSVERMYKRKNKKR